jgi:uncharacterized repeat protein (TIGR02543 family)
MTKTNHVFGGWYTDDTIFATEWDFDADIVTADTALYAKWIPTYTVSGTIATNIPGGAAIGASVQLKQGGANVGNTVIIGASGIYIITGVSTGNDYIIEVSLSGYATGTISSFNVVGDVTDKNLTLVRETIVYIVDNISFKTAWVPGNVTFPTGTSDSESATVTAAYEIGETEVTYELWHTVRAWAEGNWYTFYNNPGREGSSAASNNTTPGANRHEPVTMVTWYDAVVWLNALTEWVNANTGSSLEPVYYYDSTYAANKVAKNSNPSSNFMKESSSYSNASVYAKPGATGFRLPTRNEWELAARWRGSDTTNTVSGYTNPYFTQGDSASGAAADYNNATATGAVAWYISNSSKTKAVKGKSANALGLYDMSGNVSEWCFDWYSNGSLRIIRGGCWFGTHPYLQVGNVSGYDPDYRLDIYGFRPARTAE